MLVDAELDAGTELDATAWRSPTVHEPRLCAARVRTGGTSSVWCEAQGTDEVY